jgi:hypothetical protein
MSEPPSDLFARPGDPASASSDSADTASTPAPTDSLWAEAKRPSSDRQPIAEVVASSTRSVEAEVYESAPPIAFGAWIEIDAPGGTRLFGLVSHVSIGSLDPSRRVRAYGLSPEELARERPHVPGLIVTTLHAQLLAHAQGDQVRQTLPPFPAPIHHPVRLASEADVRRLGSPFDYLRTLAFSADPGVPTDELLVAALRAQSAVYSVQRDKERVLVDAAQTLSRLLRDDHERLGSILRRATQ